MLRALLLGRDYEGNYLTSPIPGVVCQFVIMMNRSKDVDNVWEGGRQAKRTLAAIEYAKACLAVATFIDDDLPCCKK